MIWWKMMDSKQFYIHPLTSPQLTSMHSIAVEPREKGGEQITQRDYRNSIKAFRRTTKGTNRFWHIPRYRNLKMVRTLKLHHVEWRDEMAGNKCVLRYVIREAESKKGWIRHRTESKLKMKKDVK